ncbi:hypothetical protein [Dyella flagellata]|uniref:Uncharacterized protein n=1 Tax=Dyella flagellata TaxID=1867833 RepID=A0ABQ5XCL7_9GAMM|nr:hypothetical protein [Dyella flagellata]GLQ88371.1 hypothetical protein GCM10007898_19400 [Dyella flagellata]
MRPFDKLRCLAPFSSFRAAKHGIWHVFVHWKIYVVENEHEAKIVFSRESSLLLNKATLRVGEFDAAFGEAYEHLDAA